MLMEAVYVVQPVCGQIFLVLFVDLQPTTEKSQIITHKELKWKLVSAAATLCFSCSVSFNNDDFFLSSVAGELPVAPILVLTLNQPISIDPTQRLMCIDPLMCSWDFTACLRLLSKQKHIPRREHCVWVQTLKYRIMFRLWLKVSASPVTWDLN